MAEQSDRLYEGMFLFNPAQVTSSVAAASETLKGILDRAEAEVIAMYKWDERKMAYPIDGQRRGLYMLAYFNIDGARIPQIERDVKLSDEIMRVMIVRADHLGETELDLARDKQKETLAAAALEGEQGESAGEGDAAGAQTQAQTESESSTATATAEADPEAEADKEAPEQNKPGGEGESA